MPAFLSSVPFALLCGWTLLLSLIAFVVCGADKARARRRQWRVPERTLLTLGFLGGAAGLWIGMRVFHHKTLHTKFRVLVPLAAALWIGLLILAAVRLG